MTTGERARTSNAPRELNEETLDLVRRRIGIPVRFSPREHNEVASTDSFRHFARGYGDDNPLYGDPEYAASSSWSGPIAPPVYLFSAGISRPVEWSDAEKEAMSGGDPLAGIGQYMCGERWLFASPVRPGDVMYRSQSLYGAELKSSRLGDGVGALVTHRVRWEAGDGRLLGFRYLDYMHVDRDKSKKAGEKRVVERATYTDDDVERLDALYAAESVRGAEHLSIDEVEVGARLGPIAKGPLSVTDILSWHTGTGWGMFGGGPSKIAYQNRQRIPKFYTRNEQGFWDTVQRCHWDDEWAQRMGHPAAYDYGVMRTAWMAQLVGNWMGDGAWIWKITATARKFDYLGDAHVVSGVVSEVDRDRGTVTVDAEGVNQRGETTCTARIVVILAGSDGGPAVIPEYDPEDDPEAAAP
ncbi:MAG TPA: MaoC family dehydratase N-terminal domain-containing protein [Acidimicrobiales bacterium]